MSARTELTAALRRRLALIADEESRRDLPAHLLKLREVSELIEKLVTELPPPVDSQLAHFLSRCSYDKALALLEQGS